MKKYIILFALLTQLVFFVDNHLLAQKKRKKDDKKDNKEASLEAMVRENAPSSMRETEIYLIEGMKYSALDEHRKALESFRKALLTSGGNNATINFKLAETCFRLRQMPEAEGYAKDALALEKNNKYFYLMLVNIYTAQRRYEDGIQVLKDLLAIKNAPIEYNYELADLYLKADMTEKSLECYEKLEKHFGVTENVVSQKQKVYLKLNQLDKAIQEGEKLIKANPDEKRFVILLADLLLQNERTEQALPLLEKLAQEPNPNPHTFLLLSKIYDDKNQTEKSLFHLKNAFQNPDLEVIEKVKIMNSILKKNPDKAQKIEIIELVQGLQKANPTHTQANMLAADIELLRKNKKEALYYLVEASKTDNNNIEIWKKILSLATELKQPETLVKNAELALEAFPNYAPFWLALGNGLASKKNYQKALTSFQEGKMLAINDKNLKIDFLIRLGDTYNALQRYPEADKSYEEALKLDKDNPFALNNYSYYLAVRKEKLDEAVKMVEKLNENNPDNPTFLDTYGWVMYAKGDYKKAKNIFEKVLQKNNENGTYIEHYGDVLYQLGDHNSALQQWQKAKKMGGTTDLIDKKIADKKLYE
jgi:tetratricopeptide (TPR) repeat protein